MLFKKKYCQKILVCFLTNYIVNKDKSVVKGVVKGVVIFTTQRQFLMVFCQHQGQLCFVTTVIP